VEKNTRLTLRSSSALVVAILAGVALVTVGWPLLSGRAFSSSPPAATRLITATGTTLTTSPASPVAQGIQVALNATVTPATAVGTVQFKDGTTNLGNPVIVMNGTASGFTSALPAGSRSLLAVFAPTDPAAYAPSTSPAVTFVVAGAPATGTTLATSLPSPIPQDTPVTLTATVTPPTAAGTVQFKDGTANLGNPVIVSNGMASGTTSTLTVGSHPLTAVFAPANPAAFSPSTSSAVMFVVAAPAGATTTSTALAASPVSPVAQGTPVTLTATVTPATAAGTVQFKDGTANLGNPVTVSNGTASGSTSTLAGGSHELAAVFIPANPTAFSPSTSPPLTFAIAAPTGATPTGAALITYPASPVRRGTPVSLFATVTPTTATGTVQFKDGIANLGNPVIVSNGAASGTTSTLAVGAHQLTAVFTPTDQAVFAPSTSPVLIFEVTDRGLADLTTCLTVLQSCPRPRAGSPQFIRFDHLGAGTRYIIADRPRQFARWGSTDPLPG
jgi:hypothetical protein